MIGDTGSTNDIDVKQELFDKTREVEKDFEKYFKGRYQDLKTLYEDMAKSTSFQGEACEGFMEIFEILIQYHQDLIEALPAFYQSIKDFEESLNEIKSHSVYHAIGE